MNTGTGAFNNNEHICMNTVLLKIVRLNIINTSNTVRKFLLG